MALQYAKSKKPDSLLDAFTESGKSGLINAGMNWAIPAATRAIGNIYKEVSDPGSVIGSFAQLNPTTAQLHKYIFGGKGLVSQSVKWIEDIFASGAKATAIDKSAELGTKAGNELIGARQGDYNPNEFFQTVKGKITSAGEDSLANSNRLGDSAVASAQNFPHTFMQTVQTPTGSVRLPQTVAAPIPLNNTLAAAEKMVAEFDSGSGSAAGQGFLDPKQAELRKMAQSIIDKSRDPNGGVNPVSFREAWTLKKLADRFQMYEKSRSKFELRDPTSSEPYFKTLSESMNDDIDNGLKTLKGNPLEKAKLVGYWKDAKAAVGQRLALMDAEGDKLIDVIKSKQTELPVLDEILADPKQLHRALALGEVQFPGGGQAKQSVRSDYITYKIQKMYNDSWSTSASDPTKKVFDAAKLMDTWNDPKFKDSKDLLFSQKLQGEYDQLFKQIAATQGKQQMSNARLWALKAGISVMPGLALGHISGLPSTGATAAVGLGMGVIGKLMTMKGMSRALIAAASGAPLGMSTEAFARAVAKAAAGGGVMTLIGSDGKETRGEVDADGQFVQK
jgi:hypothetical protein